jgi:hypothetical protein
MDVKGETCYVHFCKEHAVRFTVLIWRTIAICG